MNPQSPMKIPGPSNELVATSPDEPVKEEECEEAPLPKKFKKNKNAKAIKAVMSNCCEISKACEKINSLPEPWKGKKRRNETVPNDVVPHIKKKYISSKFNQKGATLQNNAMGCYFSCSKTFS